MLDAAEVEALVLEMASEDRHGLYEIVWSLNRLYPDVAEIDKIEASRSAVVALLQAGRLILSRQQWTGSGSGAPILSSDATRVLEDPRSWSPGDEFVAFEETSVAGGAA